jgi:hypothetical protein
MYDTSGAHSVCQPSAIGYDINARLGWLRAEIAETESGARARREAEEQAALLMQNPQPLVAAYGWFGLLLGLFPPAAIFCRFFKFGLEDSNRLIWASMFAVALAVCGAIGRLTARFAAQSIAEPRRYHWLQLFLLAVLLGSFWGIVTGAAGGAVFFGVGSLAGILFAVPIGVAAFPLFALLHQQLSRDGMIEESLMWPLAFGLPLLVTAAVLGI